ncbi:MAG: hypothetical protein J0648_06455 [Pelodictyon phaeoclathratiforme]|jgi:ATP-dependent DNA helicase RecG|uniref:Putative transcriptional regulator n=2 Tax=Pelodictyon phaeoclathratiforme TaxID=34090 RepID=B4SD70_PELPB|nr:putative transcriptional regulator [Pelodictyon phaeoclathratiforme BU-1]MBV5289460.1 hypothetical protein [Pelodictyon phaeoclathratiforme]
MEEMRQGNVSRRRNPLIADLFRRIQMVEGWGRGMPLIFENAPSVQFRQIAGLFIASFERPSFVEDFVQGEVDTTGKTVDKTVDKIELTDKEKDLCDLVRHHPIITQKGMADQLGLTERGIRYLTDKLQKQGVLQKIGGKKSGKWVVIDSTKSGSAGV